MGENIMGGDWGETEKKTGWTLGKSWKEKARDRVQNDEAHKACRLMLQTPRLLGNLCVLVLLNYASLYLEDICTVIQYLSFFIHLQNDNKSSRFVRWFRRVLRLPKWNRARLNWSVMNFMF